MDIAYHSNTDVNNLQRLSMVDPFPAHKKPLEIRPFIATTSVVVSNIPSSIAEFVLKLYLESIVGRDNISDVQFLPVNRALVTFVNHQCKLNFI